VLRTIRDGDEEAFVPSLAVLGGLVLAFVGIGFLIYFIHHIAMSIQASSIIAAAAEETIAAMNRLFPTELGDAPDEDLVGIQAASLTGLTWTAIGASKTGYIESIEGDSLLSLARKHETIVRMERGIGEFVVMGAPLISVAGMSQPEDEAAGELNAVFVISRHRTVEQDAGFGIRQIVDIALKALSPGVNDTTTAVMCVDYLGAILTQLAPRKIASPHRLDQGQLRVIARGPSFESLLAEAFDQIRQDAQGNVAILTRQLQALETIAGQTASSQRRQLLRQKADLIAAVAQRTIPTPHDREVVTAASVRLSEVLNLSSRPPGSSSGV